jgi:hypothetical protein
MRRRTPEAKAGLDVDSETTMELIANCLGIRKDDPSVPKPRPDDEPEPVSRRRHERGIWTVNEPHNRPHFNADDMKVNEPHH